MRELFKDLGARAEYIMLDEEGTSEFYVHLFLGFFRKEDLKGIFLDLRDVSKIFD